jgi:hypothetical protein
MTTRAVIKKAIPKKAIVVNSCTQEEQIRKISLLLIGNGHPQDGYVYKVIEMGNKVNDIDKKLTGISGTVAMLYDESIKKKEVLKSSDELRSERRERFRSILQLSATIIMLLGLLATAYFGYKNFTNIEEKIDNMGVPVVINSRGETVNLPDGYELKRFPNDYLNDTIK